jgi:hypothetical protein
LISDQVIVELISATRFSTDLEVRCLMPILMAMASAIASTIVVGRPQNVHDKVQRR